jgi:hypothetical protein
MELVIEDGTGVATANSYVSLDDANAYIDTQLRRTGWDQADDAKSQALAAAFGEIDRLAWKGEVSIYGQPHEFPRMWLRVANRERQYLDEKAIPTFVKEFQIELARALLMADIDRLFDAGRPLSQRMGNTSTTFDATRPRTRIPAHLLQRVDAYLQPTRGVRAA